METDRWLKLELRHLAALKAIAEEGTFARAARRLGYTQSAISQQIAALERIVGACLLERPPGRRPLGLTKVGELTLRHGEAILARARAARADVAALEDGVGGTLRVGTYQSVGARILPTLMQEFVGAWPRVDLRLHEAPGDGELVAMVEQGELDLTFTMLPVEQGPFDTIELLRDPYVLVVAAGSPLARKRSRPSLEEIAGLPLISFRSCRNEHRVEAHLRARGIEPRIVFRSDDNSTVQAMVAAGMGVALVPRLTMEPADERTELLDLDGRLPARLLGLAWHRDRYRSTVARAFTDLAREFCARHTDAPSRSGGARTR